MKAKLIGITEPRIPECKNAEELVAYVARVSNPVNQANHMTATKLIRYLLLNKHWSPLELIDIVIEIETTRDIGRQILRHRSFSFQEFSQRYANPTTDLGFILREARLQDTKNRQNSIETEDNNLKNEWDKLQLTIIEQARSAYDWAVLNGIAKEQASVVLPEGLTLSRLYMKGNLRSWIHYCALRMSNGTQKEHMGVAKACWDIICQEIPSISSLVYNFDEQANQLHIKETEWSGSAKIEEEKKCKCKKCKCVKGELLNE